ncbi:MAG: transketolase family protein [Candidatus Saccharibacteria bacterium]
MPAFIDMESPAEKAIRDGFGDGLLLLGKTNPDVVALSCDLSESTRNQEFAKAYPDRFVEAGVAEQNMIGLAAGLAHEGKIPFCSSYAVFSPGRSWDQIRVSVCYSDNNVKIAGHHAGLSAAADGATHQALEDIAMMRVLPNMTVLAPCDAMEARKAVLAAAKLRGPVYIRLMREKTPVFTTESAPFGIGQAQVYRKGSDLTIGAIGPQVYYALKAAERLSAEGIEAEVINFASLKPLDTETLFKSAAKTRRIVTAEEHQLSGGLGSAIAEALCQKIPTVQEFVAMKGRFGESGDYGELQHKWELDAEAIFRAAKKILKRKII